MQKELLRFHDNNMTITSVIPHRYRNPQSGQ